MVFLQQMDCFMTDHTDIAPGEEGSESFFFSNKARTILVFVIFFALCVGLQWVRGDFQNGFNGEPDEAAHYITGLMVRDYIAGFFPGSPLAFAENYYLHYPKVAFGQWPPLFYFLQAAWTLIFPVSHTSLLVLMALITTCLAFLLFHAAERYLGFWPGMGAGFLLLFAPLIQRHTGMVMCDTIGAVFCFAAALLFGRYLDSEHWRASFAFGILASVAILTKHNELSLAIMVPVAVLLAGKWRLLRTRAFWISPGLVILFCLPWDLLTFKHVSSTWVYKQSAGFLRAAMEYHALTFVYMVGYLLFVFVIVGVLVRVAYPLKSRTSIPGFWATMAAQIISVWMLHVMVPSGLERRHEMAALPALILFAVAGMVWLLHRFPLPKISYRWRGAALATLLLVISLKKSLAIPHVAHQGFPAAASYLVVNSDPTSIALVSSAAFGEGDFIAEVASREKRPGHILLRATKVLAEVDWVGRSYHSKFETPQQLMQYLEQVPVRILVMDMAPGVSRTHIALLREMVALYPERWQIVGVFTGDRSECPLCEIRMYRLSDGKDSGKTGIGVSVKDMIRRY